MILTNIRKYLTQKILDNKHKRKPNEKICNKNLLAICCKNCS